MTEYEYFANGEDYCIEIRIIGKIINYDECEDEKGIVKVADEIWVKFMDEAIMEDEKLYDKDMPYVVKALEMVQNNIRKYSKYKNNLIVIGSLKYDRDKFQNEGMIAAIIEWVMREELNNIFFPYIEYSFDKGKNKFIYKFDDIDKEDYNE